MVKNKNLISFILNYIFSNKFIKFYLIGSLLILIGIHEIVSILLKQTSEVLTLHKYSYIIYLVSISIVCSFLVGLSTVIFSSIKNNGVHLHLNTAALSRKKIFIFQIFVMVSILAVYIIIASLLLIIISSIQKETIFARYYAFNILVLILLVLILTPFIVAFNLFLKGIIAIIFSIFISLSIPSTYIISRIASSSLTHDNLSYQNDINYNNYALLNKVDNQGKIISKNLVNIVEYANYNKNNNAKNVSMSLNPVKNDSMRKFMVGDLLSQLSTDLLLTTNVPKFKNAELYKISKENYIFNASILKLENYKSGEPNEISNTNNNILIAYGDRNPFEMSYNQIFNELDNIIKKLDLKNQSTFLKSIETKTKNLNSWSQIKFALNEQKILDAFSGVRDNHWLFYLLKYKYLFNNKISKLYEDVKRKYNLEIKNFIELLFKDNNYANNVTNFKTIISKEEINNQFPSIGVLEPKSNASLIDQKYFKEDLIHFTNDLTGFTPKVITTSGTYEKINSNQIKSFVQNPQISNFLDITNSLQTKESWSNFINKNQEVSNLKEIYNVLYLLNSKINPEYVFQNNQNDVYEINKVLTIKKDKWISNAIVILIIFIASSSISLFLSYKFYNKLGGLYV